ncbi:MAG TPA: transglycosylase family protein [Actinomycetota bacterium]|nr:transglycosylase family protein [Actinomycetota bacterium]
MRRLLYPVLVSLVLSGGGLAGLHKPRAHVVRSISGPAPFVTEVHETPAPEPAVEATPEPAVETPVVAMSLAASKPKPKTATTTKKSPRATTAKPHSHPAKTARPATAKPKASTAPKPKAAATKAPTAAPKKAAATSAPKQTSYNKEQVKAEIAQAWPGDDNKALAVVSCETGGTFNPRITSSNGMYLGLWQFHRDTWTRSGGSGDPRDASPAQQTAIAWKLFQSEGWRPWGCA